jgi:hypothetical protein
MAVLLTLIAVVVFAALLQVIFVTRGGLMVNEFLPGMHTERPVGKGAVEADVDALIEGMKNGAATDPFGESVVDKDELREELLRAAAKMAAEKDEL